MCPVQIQCNWESLGSIIDHWGQYGSSLQPFAGPGHWHDMDMLLIGNSCVSHDEEMTQMVSAAEPWSPGMLSACIFATVPAAVIRLVCKQAIWAISASPMIMGEQATRHRPSRGLGASC